MRHNGRMRRVFVWLALAMAVIALVLIRSTEWLTAFGGRVTGSRLDRARRSPEFHDGKFRNVQPTRMLTGSYSEMLRHQFFGKEKREPAGPVPVIDRTTRDYATPPASGLRATWIGWASVLVEIDGHRLMTDPVFSERC